MASHWILLIAVKQKVHFYAFSLYSNVPTVYREEAAIITLLQHLFVLPFSKHCVKVMRAALVVLTLSALLLSFLWELWMLAVCWVLKIHVLPTFCTCYVFHLSLPISLLGRGALHLSSFRKKKQTYLQSPWETHLRCYFIPFLKS